MIASKSTQVPQFLLSLDDQEVRETAVMVTMVMNGGDDSWQEHLGSSVHLGGERLQWR